MEGTVVVDEGDGRVVELIVEQPPGKKFFTGVDG
jgi:hypothetical protein